MFCLLTISPHHSNTHTCISVLFLSQRNFFLLLSIVDLFVSGAGKMANNCNQSCRHAHFVMDPFAILFITAVFNLCTRTCKVSNNIVHSMVCLQVDLTLLTRTSLL